MYYYFFKHLLRVLLTFLYDLNSSFTLMLVSLREEQRETHVLLDIFSWESHFLHV